MSRRQLIRCIIIGVAVILLLLNVYIRAEAESTGDFLNRPLA